MKLIEQDRQLILVESRLANAAKAILSLGVGLLLFNLLSEEVPGLIKILVALGCGCVTVVTGLKALGGERWVFDRRTSSGRFLHNRRLLAPAREIDHLHLVFSPGSESDSYELYVALEDGTRFCVLSVQSRSRAQRVAETLAAFLEVSLKESLQRQSLRSGIFYH
jgi:hypothetical protein